MSPAPVQQALPMQAEPALPPIPIRRTSKVMWAMRVIAGLVLLVLLFAAWRLIDVAQPRVKSAPVIQPAVSLAPRHATRVHGFDSPALRTTRGV